MQSAINFNPSYGDISFLDGEINIIRDRDQTDMQAMINIFKTSEYDYKYTPNFGLNIDKYIGKPLDDMLALTIQKRITQTLLEYEIIASETDIEILHIIKENRIYFRLILSDRESLNFIFLKDEGFRLENGY